MQPYSVVGKRILRIDGSVKATGEAKFTVDVVLPGTLYGKILRSPYPHAKILSIDTGKAETLPGVKAVITGKDTGVVRFSFIDTPRYPADQYPGIPIFSLFDHAAGPQGFASDVTCVSEVEDDTARNRQSMDENLQKGRSNCRDCSTLGWTNITPDYGPMIPVQQAIVV